MTGQTGIKTRSGAAAVGAFFGGILRARVHDARRRLTIDARQGEFPGMLMTRLFDVVIVGKTHGTGVEATDNPDKVILYKGEGETIDFSR